MRRGQSLVVWAIREGRQVAHRGQIFNGKKQTYLISLIFRIFI